MVPSEVIAIDILLEPDGRMLERAESNNAWLRQAYPSGFSLDADHRPHITLLQCFVAAKDLEALALATGDVILNAKVTDLPLWADRYYYTPGPGVGLAGICARPTPELLKLQADVIAAAAPFMAPTGPIEAFTARHDNPAFDAALIDYVTGFVEHHAGGHFNPHVTTGVAPTDYLDRMIAEPFPAFAFAPAGAAIFQLGPFGTAARLLKSWDVT
jgi:hypothetical protein